MSEANKAAVRRFYEEVFNKKRPEAIDELCTSDFTDHSPMPGQAPGREGTKQAFAMYMQGFPDLHADLHSVIAEGDLVAVRFSVTATHSGALFGETPTGKKVTFEGIDFFRVKDGKAAEAWHQGNEMMVMAQLGIQPPT